MAAKSKFKAEFVGQATKLCTLGATDVEVADFFAVSVRVLHRWKLEHKGLDAAMKTGKDRADERVERSLYARAIGYEHDDVDIRVIKGKVVKTPIRKHYPPDTGAAIFWLKNRRRLEWRDKIETGVTDGEGNDVTPQDPLELARSIAFFLQKGAQK